MKHEHPFDLKNRIPSLLIALHYSNKGKPYKDLSMRQVFIIELLLTFLDLILFPVLLLQVHLTQNVHLKCEIDTSLLENSRTISIL
jgi:hypothetical protein